MKNYMELRIRVLLRNGLTSKSGLTLADTEVLREIAVRLNYNLDLLKSLDFADPKVNPYVVLPTACKKGKSRS